jgi:hypothetical protein
MMRSLRRWSLLPLLCLGACSIPSSIERLGDTSPPADFGRPGYVRALASLGAWVGGLAGGAASIALLPLTWPISAMCDENLVEDSRGELLFFPATCLAAIGHAALGAPADMLDYTLRRAWFVGDDVGLPSKDAPLPAPALPRANGSEDPIEADG